MNVVLWFVCFARSINFCVCRRWTGHWSSIVITTETENNRPTDQVEWNKMKWRETQKESNRYNSFAYFDSHALSALFALLLLLLVLLSQLKLAKHWTRTHYTLRTSCTYFTCGGHSKNHSHFVVILLIHSKKYATGASDRASDGISFSPILRQLDTTIAFCVLPVPMEKKK